MEIDQGNENSIASNAAELVIKARFSQDLREFRLKSEDINFTGLSSALKQLYNLPNAFTVKYRDQDGDLVTIACDEDLKAAIKWITQTTNKDDQQKLVHLFVISKSNDDDRLLLHGITNMLIKLSITDKDSSEQVFLPKGSEWRGNCEYPNGEKFPLTINILKVDGKTIEGTIKWESLDSITRFLGIVAKSKLKFTEYEAICGPENVQIPMNYTAVINQNTISGKVLSDDKATFNVEFIGIDDKIEGFIEMAQSTMRRSKRKYNLWTNNSLEPPTVEDQQGAFKKLVSNSVCWYDKTKRGELEPRPKEEDPKDVRKSCPGCGLPMFEQPNEKDPSQKIVACSNYPFCRPSNWLDLDYDSDY